MEQTSTSSDVKTIAKTGSFTVKTEEIFLWPGKAPGSEHLVFNEIVENLSDDPEWQMRRISLITKPSLTIYHPVSPNGIAMLIAPGGRYLHMGFDDEGTDIAKWLNALGITSFVLKYRFPNDGHINGKDVPLQDAQRAIRLIRKHAYEWNINTDKIGMMGFSAGGHLAATAGTNYTATVYNSVDSADTLNARPDFLALIYPVISFQETAATEIMIESAESQKQKLFLTYQPQFKVTKDTPCTFIVLADDDPVGIQQHGPCFYRALTVKQVPAELHIFSKGGHGFGIRRTVGPIAEWTNLFFAWLRGTGIIQ